VKSKLAQGGLVALVVLAAGFWLLRPLESPIRVIADFEGCPVTKLKKVSNMHWILNIEDQSWKRPHFFFFRVEGAYGRTVSFEIPNASPKWATLNPVYCYATRLDDVASFLCASEQPAREYAVSTGVKLPDTSGQEWHFIEDAQLVARGTNLNFCFKQKFERDAFVCMRYPYTASYNQRYLAGLKDSPYAQVVTVGASKEGRPLQIVQIGKSGSDAEPKQAILIYAREHPDEQDPSWAVQGAIQYLISDAFQASQIRKRFTFFVIPVLDPDGVSHGVYQNCGDSFVANTATAESDAFSAFFKSWIDKGNSLPLVLNLHNLESSEGPTLSATFIEHDPKYRQYDNEFHEHFVVRLAQAEGFAATSTTESEKRLRFFAGRLGSWLRDNYGSLHLLYELNSQDAAKHLTISDLRRIGGVLVLASTRYLESSDASPLLASIAETGAARAARWQKYGTTVVARNALEAERNCRWREQSDRLYVLWGGKPPVQSE
jgi:Zinc carboxypeptidase